MRIADDRPVRAHLAKLLDWGDAHASLEASVTGIPARRRGVVPPGWQYSLWQLLEHVRIAQADILEFCTSPRYTEKKWPDAYWPASPSPRGDAAWRRSIAGIRRDRRALQRLAENRRIDLAAPIPHGTGQTYLRELLLVADHTAYHVGQMVALRRQLGIWR